MVAVAPEPVDQTREYLKTLGVGINAVLQATLADVGIRGTPTLVFVNRSGVVKKVWRGELSSNLEQEVMDFVSKTARNTE